MARNPPKADWQPANGRESHLIAASKDAIRAVVFDMDGVLINSHPAHRAAWREFLRSLNIAAPDHELAFILEGRTRNEILRHFIRDVPEGDLLEYGRRKDEIFRSMEHHISPVPGVLRFLRELEYRRITCAVATSASEIRTFSTIERMGLGAAFNAVVTAADVDAGKPDPQVYEIACQRLGVAPENALAFDDAPAGVSAARTAGMRCIGVATDEFSVQLLQAGAERIISDFSDVTFDSVSRSCPHSVHAPTVWSGIEDAGPGEAK